MLLGEHAVVRVEIVQVIGRDHPEVVQDAARQLDVLGQRISMLGEELGKHIAVVEQHRANPRQVVQPHLVDENALRLDAEQPCAEALEGDGDVAEPDGAVAGVEQRARDDPDRIREVHDPRAGRRAVGDTLRELEHHRHRPHRLRESTGARRLLADAAAAQGHCLVEQACGLPADANLEEDERGAVDRSVEIARLDERAGVARAIEHAPGEPADHLEPLGVDVVQRDLADVEL